jgi:hypothetical protein
MRNLLVLIGILVMLNFVVGLNVSEELNTNVILHEYNIPIEMTLTAAGADPGNYNVYTFSEIEITPMNVFEHDGGTLEKTFYLKRNSRLDVDGLYVFKYTLNHREVEQVDNKITLKLISIADVLDVSTNIITIEDSEAMIKIKNLENINLNDVEISFSSVIFDYSDTFSLSPNEEKVISVPISIDKLRKTKAGTYVIDVVISTPTGDVSTTGKLYLNEQREIRSEEDSAGILVRTTTVNKVNIGNSVEDVSVVINKNILSRLFTSFNIEPTGVLRDGSKVAFTWNDRIYPDETLKVIVKTNWLLPFLIIIAIALSYVGITRLLQKRVEIKKSVSVIKTKGGDFALKIHLNLKARHDVDNVTLTDRIPAIVKLYNKFGTVRPSKIDAHKRQIQWVIGDLDAGEERVFDYIVYSKVGVLGKFSLPKAKAIFEKEGGIHETTSNSVFFLSSQTSN